MGKRFTKKRMLALLLALLCLPWIPALAADAGLPDACGLTLSLTEGDLAAWPEIKDLEFSAHLYKVAAIRGDFTLDPLPAFADVTTAAGDTLAALDPESPAESVLELAKALKELVTAEGNPFTADYDVTISGGEGKLESAATGLYLLTVDELQDGGVGYSSLPTLLWLPRATGIVNGTYKFDSDVKALIKLEREELNGKLRIVKTLLGRDENYRGACFVFKVYGTKTDEKTGEETVVIDDVYTISFPETVSIPATDYVEIDGIPVGTKVTVEEVYAPGYVLAEGDRVQVLQIEAEKTAEARFSNVPDSRIRYYSMVENCYVYKADSERGYAFEKRSLYVNGRLVDEKYNPGQQ